MSLILSFLSRFPYLPFGYTLGFFSRFNGMCLRRLTSTKLAQALCQELVLLFFFHFEEHILLALLKMGACVVICP